ncbi:hypothetical protein [Myceligenerans xiligouense]|uniref:hypothetical protein n=1 Tax=Myceligenerans xiligouense TaxID=253184 RepID=UPI000F4FF606|nr:hypothetical protein [Myceligenerans xiligouense]
MTRHDIRWIALPAAIATVLASCATTPPARIPDTTESRIATSQPAATPDADPGTIAASLTERFADDPKFGSAGVEDGELFLYWYGSEPQIVHDIAGDVPVVVRDAPLEPGSLRDAATTLVETEPDVTSAGPAHDFTGLTITVDPRADAEDLAASLGTRLDIPVQATTDSVVPFDGD